MKILFYFSGNILMTKSFCLFVVLSQALLSSNMGYAVEIIGHRGASFDAPGGAGAKIRFPVTFVKA